MSSGTLFIVATPIGNLEDITARALRVLRSVAVIAAEDTRRTARLLAHYGISTRATSLHEHNELEKTPSLLARLHAGDDVALVSDAGTPTISDPGQRLVSAAIAAGLRIEPIPGPSAVIAALAGSGMTSASWTFLGFAPSKGAARQEWLDRLRTARGLAVFFEAPHRIRQTLADAARVVGREAPVVVARELTKVHEEWVRGPIHEVATQLAEPVGEYTVVVDVGQSPEDDPDPDVAQIDWLAELGRLTESSGLSRRRAINLLAKRTGIPPNQVYAAIESAKKLVK